jgi:hypothetical protein
MKKHLLNKVFIVFAVVAMLCGFMEVTVEQQALANEVNTISVYLTIEGYADDNTGSNSTILPTTKIVLPEGSTVLDALSAAANSRNIGFVNSASQYGEYISSIGGKGGGFYGGWDGWSYRVNGVSSFESVDQKVLEDGNKIVFYYGDYYQTYWPEVSSDTTTPGALKLVLTGTNGSGDSIAIQEADVLLHDSSGQAVTIGSMKTDENGTFTIDLNINSLSSGDYYIRFQKYTGKTFDGEQAAKPGFPEIVKTPWYKFTVSAEQTDIIFSDVFVPEDIATIQYNLPQPLANAPNYVVDDERINITGSAIQGLTVEARLKKNDTLLSTASDIARGTAGEYAIHFDNIKEAGDYVIELATVMGNDKSILNSQNIAVSVPVSLRIEGDHSTVLSNFTGNTSLSALDFLQQVTTSQGISLTISESAYGPYVSEINGITEKKYNGSDGWLFMVERDGNFISPMVGAGSFYPQKNDEIVFYYGGFDTHVPEVSISPENPKVGEEIVATVTQTYFDWVSQTQVTENVTGATIRFNGNDFTTDDQGQASLGSVSSAGDYPLTVSYYRDNDYPLLIKRSHSYNIPFATFTMRVEGKENTILPKTEEKPFAFPYTAQEAFEEVLTERNIPYNITDTDYGPYIDEINGEVKQGLAGWNFYVRRNGEIIVPDVGVGSFAVSDGDELVFYYGSSDTHIPEINFTPKYPVVNRPIQVTVTAEWTEWVQDDGGNWIEQPKAEKVAGVKITFGGENYFTDANGQVTLPAVDTAGEYSFSISKDITNSLPALVRNQAYEFYVYENPPADIPTPVLTGITYDNSTKVLRIAGTGENGLIAVAEFRGQRKQTEIVNGSFSIDFTSVETGEGLLEVYLKNAQGQQGNSILKPLTILVNVELTSQAIQDGITKAITYLKSQQGEDGNLQDWAAIALNHVGEDVSAIQVNGKSHLDYLKGHINEETYQSTTGKAKAILVVLACGEDPRAFVDDQGVSHNLVQDLLDRQDNDGHFGMEGEETWVNAHAWAIIALEAAEETNYNKEAAKIWLMNHVNSNGGWGWQISGDYATSDPDMTSVVIRALALLGETKESSIIANALNYLNGNQDANGGIVAWGQSNVYSTLEVTKALLQLGINPVAGRWQQEEGNLISYILAQQKQNGVVADQVKPTADALEVFYDFNQYYAVTGNGQEQQSNQEGNTPQQPNRISIRLLIVGQENRTLFEQDNLVLSEDDVYGLTPLGALEKSGVDYGVKNTSYGKYIYTIEGQEEDTSGRSTAGWKYKVNGRIPNSSADAYELGDGDEVLWFWAISYRDQGPGETDDLSAIPPEISEEQQKAKEIAEAETKSKLQNIRQELSEVFSDEVPQTAFVEVGGQRVLIVGSNNPMTEEEREYLKNVYEKNQVKIKQKSEVSKDNTIEDDKGEVKLKVGKGALSEDIEITIEEKEDKPRIPTTFRTLSNIYDFGPDGLRFNRDIEVSLPFTAVDEVDPKNVVLAWYDEEEESWVTIPAVVDLANGRITGLLQHFTKVAVLLREKAPIAFKDVQPEKFPWAVREISYLSALGIIDGIGDQSFAPRQGVTRAQFIKMLVEALNIEQSEVELEFTDIQKDKWYYHYLQRAVAAGIVQGNEDGTLAPNREITRQEMAVMLCRAASLAIDEDLDEELSFKDKTKIALWAKKAVKIAEKRGLVKGFADQTFRPQETVNRAQSAVVIYRLLKNRVGV